MYPEPRFALLGLYLHPLWLPEDSFLFPDSLEGFMGSRDRTRTPVVPAGGAEAPARPILSGGSYASSVLRVPTVRVPVSKCPPRVWSRVGHAVLFAAGQ